MLRIAMLNSAQKGTGVGNYTFSIFHELKNHPNCEVSLYNYRGDRTNKLITRFGGHETIKRPFAQNLVIIFLAFVRSRYMQLYFRKIPSDFDLYHITGGSTALTVGNFDKIIISIHDLWAFSLGLPFKGEKLIEKQTKKTILRADCIICPSNSTKLEVLKFVNILPSKIKVIPYGIDHKIFKPGNKEQVRRRLNLPIDTKIILHVGSEEKRKNIPVLIKSFAKLIPKFDKLMLIRVGYKTPTTSRLINELKISDKIFLC